MNEQSFSQPPVGEQHETTRVAQLHDELATLLAASSALLTQEREAGINGSEQSRSLYQSIEAKRSELLQAIGEEYEKEKDLNWGKGKYEIIDVEYPAQQTKQTLAYNLDAWNQLATTKGEIEAAARGQLSFLGLHNFGLRPGATNIAEVTYGLRNTTTGEIHRAKCYIDGSGHLVAPVEPESKEDFGIEIEPYQLDIEQVRGKRLEVVRLKTDASQASAEYERQSALADKINKTYKLYRSPDVGSFLSIESVGVLVHHDLPEKDEQPQHGWSLVKGPTFVKDKALDADFDPDLGVKQGKITAIEDFSKYGYHGQIIRMDTDPKDGLFFGLTENGHAVMLTLKQLEY